MKQKIKYKTANLTRAVIEDSMDNSHTELGYEKESDGDEFGDMQVDIRKQKEEQRVWNMGG